MTLNDLHAAQIESIYFILLSLGAYTFCLCMTAYICTKMIVEAITVNAALLAGEVSKQKVVIEVPVYDPTATYNHWINRRTLEAKELACNGFIPS